jgi:hypothetical protein
LPFASGGRRPRGGREGAAALASEVSYRKHREKTRHGGNCAAAAATANSGSVPRPGNNERVAFVMIPRNFYQLKQRIDRIKSLRKRRSRNNKFLAKRKK